MPATRCSKFRLWSEATSQAASPAFLAGRVSSSCCAYNLAAPLPEVSSSCKVDKEASSRSGKGLYSQFWGTARTTKPLLESPEYPAPSQADKYILPEASTSRSVIWGNLRNSSSFWV